MDCYIFHLLQEVIKMGNSAVNEKWISLEEAAEHLGIKPVTIRSWIRNNKRYPCPQNR